MEAYHCPQCAAEVGATVEEIDSRCWKCGLEFGDEDGTDPVLRDKGWALLVVPLLLR